MAALPETPFALLLRADTEQTLPDSDKEVQAALAAYGAVFSKLKKHAPERLDLLAGLMWVHTHQLDLHVVWSAASVAQHKVLAKALRLDYGFRSVAHYGGAQGPLLQRAGLDAEEAPGPGLGRRRPDQCARELGRRPGGPSAREEAAQLQGGQGGRKVEE
jgi:hypothetical protein